MYPHNTTYVVVDLAVVAGVADPGGLVHPVFQYLPRGSTTPATTQLPDKSMGPGTLPNANAATIYARDVISRDRVKEDGQDEGD